MISEYGLWTDYSISSGCSDEWSTSRNLLHRSKLWQGETQIKPANNCSFQVPRRKQISFWLDISRCLD
jgi:hypothetical protein